ncbi:hypothetical protein SISSUDRAFT_1056459 [Sistotremastrum suecicum HHB10207 ss-3]|uniref:MYND-type domain-containing protein n=1 Tax=Sistotremastrum suecicum HHB10207 ss-3 TaxID=1314776 RepID=A0A165WTW3_9AGAM|nr:hypothetical protein SISSUDRAFT_1056459 [Sistotremastrum suecicum HHB10207 ss-3]
MNATKHTFDIVPDEPYIYEFTDQDVVLDLHGISVMLNYERGATEPRFRHAKLIKVATTRDFETARGFQTIDQGDLAPRTGLLFGKYPPSSNEETVPDLPSNMLAQPVPPGLQHLTPKQLETYYWQARNHEGCYDAIALFQYFIDLFPASTRLRVRSVKNDSPKEYYCLADARTIHEFELTDQLSLNMVSVLPERVTYISGLGHSTCHAVLGFAPPGRGPYFPETVLDLASLQFGETGRGFKGRGTFVLEDTEEYVSRLATFSRAHNFEDSTRSERINEANIRDNVWLVTLAVKVKERWENGQFVPWCDHCGAPPSLGHRLLRCSQCKQVYYCDAEHQLSAWPFHRHFCQTI